jgi:hypothetical protein
MQRTMFNMQSLFAQLGEPNDEAALIRFIDINAPLPDGMRLHEAPFWSPSQAAFLREAIQLDAEWAKVVDDLNARLHR